MYSNLLPQRTAVAATAVFFFGLVAFSPAGISQEKKKPEPDPKDKKAEKSEEKKPETPPLYTVKEAPFEIKVELEGIFEARKASEITVEPKAWSDLTLIEALPHGTEVKKGDVIARFDTEKLKKEIEDLEVNAPLAEHSLITAEAELDTLEKMTPLELESSRRGKMHAEENLAYFEDVTLPMQKKDATEGMKRYVQNLAYAQEELNQLKKMYEADDMTEETEEIILQRAQNQVDAATWSLEQAKARTDRVLNTSIPRDHEAKKHELEKTQVNWRASEKTMRDALEKKRLDVAKARRDHEKAAEKLAEMREDLKSLTVNAPHDGIVYYGAALRGKWITGAVIEKKLVPGGKVMPKEVILTLVDPAKQQIRASVPEAKLKNLEPGIEGMAHPAWDADAKAKTKLESLAYVPFADKTFDSVFSTPLSGKDQIYPGMGAKIALEVYKNEKALAVPKSAVKKEGNGHVVILKDGKKRKVKVGKSSGTQTEILEGLKVGDEVKTK